MCLGWLQPRIPVTRPRQALALESCSTATSSTQSNSARPSQHLQHLASDRCSRAGREGLETMEEGLPGRCWPVPLSPPPAVLLAVPKPHPSGISLQCKKPPKFSALPFPRLFQPDSSLHIPLKSWHYQPGCCVTAATPLPECVCRHRPSSLCRVPRHVDPRCCICFYPTVRSSPGAPRCHPRSSEAAAGLKYRGRGSLIKGSTVHPRRSPHTPDRALHLKTCTLAMTLLSRTRPSPGRDAASRGGG